MLISRRTLLLEVLGGLAIAGRGSAAWGQTASAARAVLLGRGLIPSSGHYWLAPREAPLKRAAESLDALERVHHVAMVRAGEILAVNEAIRVRLAQAEEAERTKRPASEPASRASSAKSGLGNGPPEKLHSQLTDVTGLGEQTPLQQTMIAAVNARIAVQLAILTILRDAPALEKVYQPLKADPAVQSALKQVDRKARLGPARVYPRDVARAEALAPGAFRREILGYQESGRFCVAAILNETCSATFSFQPQAGPLLLTTSVAQRLGLAESSLHGPVREIELAGQKVAARAVRLASLRLGAAVIKDVEALVLPPEAESLGSELSAAVLTGYQVVPQPRRMILTLVPQAAK